MRRTMIRTMPGSGLLLALALMTGCKEQSTATKPSSKPSTTDTVATLPQGPSARAKADEFLKALSEGKAKPDDLTPAFKKTISKPMTDEEKKVGYSDADVQNFLSKFEKMTVEDVKESGYGNTIVLRGRAKSPNKVDAFCLKMIREANGLKVDWLHRSDRFLAGDAPKTEEPELAAASDTARNFLETLIGGDLRQAQALMLPSWLASIEAPSETDKKNGFAYNVGFVTQKMKSWRGETIAYSMPKSELTGNKDAATVTAELESGGQKKTYQVKLVKDKTTGQWLVEDFAKV
ncbi:hypothetical protein [Zavarzinella formosa]|uniref:hypothetical protein n=1 Tax=Zavarzinella formosa TaxID=360055 RepID=UPI0002FF6DF5|nr:hypothetical protein [Zavarzinella formosa]